MLLFMKETVATCVVDDFAVDLSAYRKLVEKFRHVSFDPSAIQSLPSLAWRLAVQNRAPTTDETS